MKKAKKILAAFLATAALAATFMSIPASAITLAESFYSDTSVQCVQINVIGGDDWTKSCWAGTKGYSGHHYVRAYIGGTSSDPTNAWVDTGRVYTYSNFEAKCTTSKKRVPDGNNPKTYFPTGYGKYGYA